MGRTRRVEVGWRRVVRFDGGGKMGWSYRPQQWGARGEWVWVGVALVRVSCEWGREGVAAERRGGLRVRRQELLPFLLNGADLWQMLHVLAS